MSLSEEFRKDIINTISEYYKNNCTVEYTLTPSQIPIFKQFVKNIPLKDDDFWVIFECDTFEIHAQVVSPEEFDNNWIKDDSAKWIWIGKYDKINMYLDVEESGFYSEKCVKLLRELRSNNEEI